MRLLRSPCDIERHGFKDLTPHVLKLCVPVWDHLRTGRREFRVRFCGWLAEVGATREGQTRHCYVAQLNQYGA
jgi:hypothetical protein